jgi:hypothetical protein
VARSELDIILRVIDKGSKNLEKFKTSLSGMAIALGAAKVAGETWQAAMAGAQMTKAQRSFASMAKSVGQDIDQIARAMIDASGGAISMQDSMLAASQAIRLGVAKTPEDFAKLTEAATNLGAAMGRGPVEALNDIVRGIGRMSPLILDNIGIMTSGGKVFDDYAESIGKTTEELTDAEKKQALLNKAIEDGSNIIKAMPTGFEKLDAAVKDASNSIKEELGEALDPLANFLADALAESNDLADALETLHLRAGFGGTVIDQYGNQWRMTNEEIFEAAAAMEGVGVRVNDLSDRFTNFPPLVPEVLGEEQFKTKLQTLEEFLADWSRKAQRSLTLTLELQAQEAISDPLAGQALGGGGESNIPQQHGGTFTVPPGFPNDSFRFGASSGERVQVSNDERSFFGGSTVNINNGTDIEAFEEMLRTIQ